MAEADRTPAVTSAPRRWALWRNSTSVLALIFLVEFGAIAGLLTTLVDAAPDSPMLARFILLCLMAGLFAEAVDRSDRIRRYLAGPGATVNAGSVWSIAGIVTLPAGWAALFVAAFYTHMLFRVRTRDDRSTLPHRILFSGSTVIVAAITASATLTGLQDALTLLPVGPRHLVALALTVIVFQLVNYVLVCVVVYLATRPSNWQSVLLGREELTFEYVTLILGVFTGEVLLYAPWLTPGVLAILALLYRGSMVTKLQAESSTDQKTGLLNFTSWRDATIHSLVRTARLRQPVALMLIDLDHFKRINDTHGHLVGDQVLAAVADCLRTDLREYDAVGRFGGEEFVVFLDNADLYAAVAAANRLRTSIGEVAIDGTARVTASIGIAHSAKSAASLEALLERADAALYEAKSGGRDQVRAVSASGEVAQPAA